MLLIYSQLNTKQAYGSTTDSTGVHFITYPLNIPKIINMATLTAEPCISIVLLCKSFKKYYVQILYG